MFGKGGGIGVSQTSIFKKEFVKHCCLMVIVMDSKCFRSVY